MPKAGFKRCGHSVGINPKVRPRSHCFRFLKGVTVRGGMAPRNLAANSPLHSPPQGDLIIRPSFFEHSVIALGSSVVEHYTVCLYMCVCVC